MWEPQYMRTHSNIFVPIEEITPLDGGTRARFVMPRLCDPAVSSDLEDGLINGVELLKMLWLQPGLPKPNWRPLLHTHLHNQIEMFTLRVSHIRVDAIIGMIPDITTMPCAIHGDATLANMLHSNGRWYFIDPLDRPYIPGDPHVDLGKMYQSCTGYEMVLSGFERPEQHTSLMIRLAEKAGLDWYVGLLWMMIHIVRLLPYQDERVRLIYEDLFRSMKL